ncbi:hypothetical protein WR25_13480 [Diploscapter pachys]|uniref:EGF-like domain-containing protein n=1 Tax=Diploscapter pachys TaxID=2018661 RepID=A0A2A2KFH5_9BILA|nr:hypothetical protein WR25_13480 [Diploscapter pachys]
MEELAQMLEMETIVAVLLHSSCADGYSGSQCQLYDFCGKNTTCQNYGKCVNLWNGTDFMCQCIRPNTQGRYCEDSDTLYAIMEGRCYMSNNSYLQNSVNNPQNDWKCTKGCPGNGSQWCGKNQDRVWVYKFDTVVADDNPCKNNPTLCDSSTQGVCIDLPSNTDGGNGTDTGYLCVCAPGSNCANETDECIPNQCLYQSTCVDLFLDYKCICLPGTNGKNCENNINDCIPINVDGQWYPTPCNTKDSQATCQDGINSYTCTCGSQWTGYNCSMNIIIRDVLLAIYGEINLEMVPLLEELMKNPTLIKDMVPFILGTKTYDERYALSWSVGDLFEWISFEEKALHPDLDLYAFNDIVLGNCFTFNHRLNPNYTYLVRDGGTPNGLRAKMRFQQQEYLPWTDTASILLFVHNANDYIFAESVRHNAEPYGTCNLDVYSTVYTKLGGRYGQCIKNPDEVEFFYYDKSFGYATEGCLRSCYQRMVNFSCNCMDPRYPIPAGSEPCQLSERSCVEQASNENGDPSTWPTCVCPQACFNKMYSVTWTRSEYVAQLAECPDPSNQTCTSQEMDTVRVVIRLPILDSSLYQETPAMTFNKFISYLGGLLGVLMGVSIISFIEVFFLIFRLVSILISGKRI